MNTHQNSNLKKDLINYAESSLIREVCGFISEQDGDLVLKKVINTSADNNVFLIKPIDFLQEKLSGNLVGIFHSHIEDSEEPSEIDKINAENCMYPYLIYSLKTEKFSLFDRSYFDRSEKCVNQLKGILDD